MDDKMLDKISIQGVATFTRVLEIHSYYDKLKKLF